MKEMKVDNNGEGFSISRGMSESKGNQNTSFKSFDKLNLKCFICHQIGHFKKNYSEKEYKGDFVQIVVV